MAKQIPNFISNKKLFAAQLNATWKAISGDKLLGIDQSTRLPKNLFDIGDLTEISGGSMVNDVVARNTGKLKVYDSGSILIGESTWENLLSSGDAGGAGAEENSYGKVLSGIMTNEPKFWMKKFHVLQSHINSLSKNPEGFDIDGKISDQRFIFMDDANLMVIYHGVTAMYKDYAMMLHKDKQFSFKIKEGENFFALNFLKFNAGADNLEIYIDGIAMGTYGLTDEIGTARSNSITSYSTITDYRACEWFFGLNGSEHVITVKNNDSASRIAYMEAVKVGYRSKDYSIDHKIKAGMGTALVRGSKINFPETELTFAESKGSGHSAAIVGDNDTELITKLDGVEPAMTFCKHEEEVEFSGTASNLKVMNHHFFPDAGICLLSHPYGEHFLFSYDEKLAANIQSHEFNGVLWKSKPQSNYTPGNNFDTSTPRGSMPDLIINLIGEAPILITSTNNKIDFKLTIGGVTNTYVATILEGAYAADLIKLGDAASKAMQTAASINGDYILEYNVFAQRWNWSVRDDEVEDFQLLFNSGANFASSVHPTLGYSNIDLVGTISYQSQTNKQHLCPRSLKPDDVYIDPYDPRIKHSAQPTISTGSQADDVRGRMGFGSIHETSLENNWTIIMVDEDCCGISLTFMSEYTGCLIGIQIDNGQMIHSMYTHDTRTAIIPNRARLVTCFVTFPRGSKQIRFQNLRASRFSGQTNCGYKFVCARQWFTKPAWEKLERTQSILKVFDISPLSLKETFYGNTATYQPYVPAVTDNVNTVTESGTWTHGTHPYFYNGQRGYTTQVGAYLEIDFTIAENGGGFRIEVYKGTGQSNKVGMFLSQTAINESTDRIMNQSYYSSYSDHVDFGHHRITGLPAGTYKLRLKKEDSNANMFSYARFFIIDAAIPEDLNYVVPSVTAEGMGVTYPINVRRQAIQQDEENKVPSYLLHSGYNEGKCSFVDVSMVDQSTSRLAEYELYDVISRTNYYYQSVHVLESTRAMRALVICKAMMFTVNHGQSYIASQMRPIIDGRIGPIDGDARTGVKNGSYPSSKNNLMKTNILLYEQSCTASTTVLFLVSDTRGIIPENTIILEDNVGAKQKAVVLSVVQDTSFTIKVAHTLGGVIDRVYYPGYHAMKVQNTGTGIVGGDSFDYEPLPICPSKALIRGTTDLIPETVSTEFEDIVNGADAFYPVHSDGIAGNWKTSIIQVLEGELSSLKTNLKNIGVTSLDATIRITSTRMVKKESSNEMAY